MTYTINIDSNIITVNGSNPDQSSIYSPYSYLDISSSTDGGLIDEKLILDTSQENQQAEVQELQLINNSEPKASIEAQSLLPIYNAELSSNSQTSIIQSVNAQATPITLVVNTTADQNDGSADNGLSLRDAIIIANNDPNANDYDIVLTSGATYQLTAINLSTDTAQGGDLDIYAQGKVTIRTDGNQRATINALTLAIPDRVIEVGDERDFSVTVPGNLILENIEVTGALHDTPFRKGGGGIYISIGSSGLLKSVIVSDNLSTGNGGGIDNRGTLLLLDSLIDGNYGDTGGGIYNIGTLTILNSAIRNNQSDTEGGGITTFEVATIINSTINHNSSLEGGGIYNNSGTLSLTNVTVSSNKATRYNGGGLTLTNDALSTIVNSTITNNTSLPFLASDETTSGGIDNSSRALLKLRNTIVTQNMADIGADIRNWQVGIVDDDGSNLIDLRLDGQDSYKGTVIDNNIDAKLGPLQNNGGFLLTHALLAGSPAIDAGNNTNVSVDVLDLNSNGNTGEFIPFDQRGIGYPRIVGNSVDIGAFEYIIDSAQYGASNPDLIVAFGYNLDALRNHYYSNGINEGRSPDNFDEDRYIASSYLTGGDLITAFGLNGAAATQHYITNGYSEGRPTKAFDPARYLDSYPDLINVYDTNTLAATQHYITNGFFENPRRDPNIFPSDRYLASHGDLILAYSSITDYAAKVEEASKHYLISGRNEPGRQITFEPFAYMTQYPDVAVAFNGDPNLATFHYITTGYGEGRRVV